MQPACQHLWFLAFETNRPMKASRKFALALIGGASPILAIAIGLIVYWRLQAHLPEEVETILADAEVFELLSINPEVANLKEQPAGAKVFHEYRVFGFQPNTSLVGSSLILMSF